jgi:hypothetical protein
MAHLDHLQQMKTQQAARQFAMKVGQFTESMVMAKVHATRLTGAEVMKLISPINDAVEKARKGKMSEACWFRLCTALNVGQAIEAGGVVRGLSAQLDAAHDVLLAVAHRAETGGEWKHPTLWANELETLRELARNYKFQLKQLSYGEYIKATQLATSRVRSAGGQVVQTAGME